MDDNGVTRSIHLSSSLHFDSLADYRAAGQGKAVLPGQTAGVDNGYGLQGNPSLHELQDSISELENGKYTLLYPSGMTALSALAALLKSGDHWLLPDNVYGPVRRWADYLSENYQIGCDYYDASSVGSISALINDKTKLIHIESPSSVTFENTDVEAVVKLAKNKSLLTSADNTWASGVLYKPLEQGIDISILSLTKYVAGYSDVFMGSFTIKDPKLYEKLSWFHRVWGYTVSPVSAALVRRGLESLEVRMSAHGDHANQLIKSITSHPKITKIYQGKMPDSNGLFSIELDRVYSDKDLEKAFATLKTFKIGESWGGTRSLVLPFQPEELSDRHNAPKNTIIRFHAGLDKFSLQQTDINNFLEAL